MSLTASEEILARYKKTETTTDTLGRAIVVRKLKPSQQVAVMTMADTDLKSPLSVMQIAAAVVKIDDNIYPFAKSRDELLAVVDVLDDEGLAAALEGVVKLNGGQIDADGKVQTAANIAEQVKND